MYMSKFCMFNNHMNYFISTVKQLLALDPKLTKYYQKICAKYANFIPNVIIITIIYKEKNRKKINNLVMNNKCKHF